MNRHHDPLGVFSCAYANTVARLADVLTGRTRRGPNGSVFWLSGGTFAPMNGVMSTAAEPDVEEMVRLVEEEGPLDVPWSFQVRGVPSDRLVETAAGYGLFGTERQALMVREADQGAPEPVDIPGLAFRSLDADGMALYHRVLAAGFEAPPEVLAAAASPKAVAVDGLTYLLAELDGTPVATGMTAVSDGVNGVFNIAVPPESRRRAPGTAMAVELVRRGFDAGVGTAYLYASEAGEPLYRSLGFRTEEHMTLLHPAE
jgi:ribosomal protein S18 acetylase RimI-like enzyme